MRKIFYTIAFAIMTLVAYSQPSNDNCNTAQNLGTLPTPAACPNGVGNTINVTGTNINATAPNPYTYLLGCQTSGNQPAPALDVWYSFVASGNQVTINITPGVSPFLPSPAITLWSGSCGSLTGFNCDNNGTATGNNSVTFQPLTPGQTYYIQVSGMTSTGAGNFNMAINASNDCNNCLQNVSLTTTPNPVNGTYLPGQTVNFCFTVNGYNQVSANWLHGVIPSFGNGWNLATLTTTPPTSCSGTGTWQWFNSNTSSATGSVTGPGFYYNVGGGGAGNNYGDNGSTCVRTFCWSIQTNSSCGSGNNLNISINTTADGETGSWTSIACQGDPNFNFSSQLNCCQSTATGTPPTCFNGTNGSATVTTTGGVAPFTYSWNTTPVQTGQTATNLSPGNYTVTVSDNAGCVSTATVSLTNPPAMTAPITSTMVSCNGGTNGSATVTTTGSTGPYTYSWNTVPIQTGQTATNLPAGTYTVTVTSALSCTITNTVTITQPAVLNATTTTVNATCGQLNGSSTANPTGGTGPYTYSWSTVPVQTGQTATGLGAGSYSCTITDSKGCTKLVTATIISSGSISVTATPTNVSCFGGTNGSAIANPTGGSTYTYSWNTVPVQITQTATNLPIGNYTVTVNSGGCIGTATVSITQPPALTAAITTSNVSCYGLSNGTSTVTVSGGTPGYTYLWTTTPTQTTSVATGLSSGTYSVNATDANGCTVIASANITQPSQLTLGVVSSTNPSCSNTSNGQIVVSASGGVGPTYFYTLNSGSPQTSGTFNNLSSGTYTISVVDANQCSQQVQVSLNQPFPISSSFTVTNVNCNGGNNGQIQLTPIGGTPPYTYNWSNSTSSNPATGLTAGNYSVTITDAVGCQFVVNNIVITQPTVLSMIITPNPSQICIGQSSSITSIIAGGTPPYTYGWSSGQTISNITVTPTITTGYTLQVSDSKGCAISATTTVVVNPSLAVSTSASQGTVCIGQQTTLSAQATGGNGGPYTFTWNPGNQIGQNITITPNQTTQYTVTVSDGCSANSTSQILINVNLLPVVQYTTTPLSGCEPLTVTLTSTTPNISNCSWTVNSVNINSCATTQTLNSGTYTAILSLVSSNGCSNSSSPITINVYPDANSLFSANPLIANLLEPTINFTNLSTVGNYNWSFGDGNFSNVLNPIHTYTDTGTYNVQLIVTSPFGCQDTSSLSIYISELFSLYVPNAFTPNGDGKNDLFTPVVIGAEYYEFWIFNRWGEEIYYSSNKGDPWNGVYKGQLVQQDVYVYKLIAKEKQNGKVHSLTGHVTVIK